MSFSVFIPGNVPSSKNSNIWTGKFLVKSKTTSRYIRQTKEHWGNQKTAQMFKSATNEKRPAVVTFLFIRGSKHKFDYINAAQIVQDLMVKNNWIEDDNSELLLPVFEPFKYDKKNPGVVISV